LKIGFQRREPIFKASRLIFVFLPLYLDLDSLPARTSTMHLIVFFMRFLSDIIASKYSDSPVACGQTKVIFQVCICTALEQQVDEVLVFFLPLVSTV
jgi:hypothetical protein